jgi:hypothetical protein
MPSGDLPLDHGLLEKLFAAADLKSVNLTTKVKSEIKTLLDGKRAQNLGIFMAGFKTPLHDLDRILNTLPGQPGIKISSFYAFWLNPFFKKIGSLPLEHVIALRKLAPTPEEKEAYEKYQGDKRQLSDIDQFLMAMMSIRELRVRLDLLLWIYEFPAQLQELEPEIALAKGAVSDLLSSDRFRTVFNYVLSLGNYVNGGTAKGAAHGVHLKCLSKLADARGSDKKTTLMDFLVLTLQKLGGKSASLVDFADDLEHAAKAAETSIKGLSVWLCILKK